MEKEKEIKETKEKWNKDLVKIFLTALITSILTLGSSYFLMFSQLEKEQEYWITRLKTERLQVLLDREIKLFEDINTSILIIEVLAKDFKISAIKFRADIEMAKEFQDRDINNNDYLANKAIEYHKHINNLTSKLQMAEFYFGHEVDSLINPLSKTLGINYNTNLILRDSVEINGLESVFEYFKRDFETVEELTENRLKILKAMRKEMDLVANYLYKIEE